MNTVFHNKWFGICIMAFLICSISLDAQSRGKRSYSKGENYHFGFVYGVGAYTNLQIDMSGTNPTGNFGGSIGAGYEFRNNGFWISLGAGYHFHRSSITTDLYSDSRPGMDTKGKSVTLLYDVRNQKDQNEWGFVEVPLMLGYYVKGFYVGTGAKVAFPMATNIKSSGKYEVRGKYEEYPDPFHDMPEHDYSTWDFESKNSVRLKPSVSLCIELGYDVLSSVYSQGSMCYILKIGGYFEYGLNSMVRTSDTNVRLDIDPMNASSVSPNPVLGGLTDAKRIVPYSAGMKITLLIGGSRNARGTYHRGCTCYN